MNWGCECDGTRCDGAMWECDGAMWECDAPMKEGAIMLGPPNTLQAPIMLSIALLIWLPMRLPIWLAFWFEATCKFGSLV